MTRGQSIRDWEEGTASSRLQGRTAVLHSHCLPQTSKKNPTPLHNNNNTKQQINKVSSRGVSNATGSSTLSMSRFPHSPRLELCATSPHYWPLQVGKQREIAQAGAVVVFEIADDSKKTITQSQNRKVPIWSSVYKKNNKTNTWCSTARRFARPTCNPEVAGSFPNHYKCYKVPQER
ncbi:hypothetical protein ElyMa_006521500 [Elysia marginata]|uniref:Uncharacterized protein n=1 Tax=Elysia marginata TaxID=1093978 RepID=A0AAV4I952_9GAST|nr:hypothetical protein ElyMa_006521500 [Elysia marginata]